MAQPIKTKFVETKEKMVLVLKKEATAQDIADLEKELFDQQPASGFDAKKYNGVLQLIPDPLQIQKKMRDEWERDIN